ncbi:vanadium-dependent haloperoxidase [Lunatibacter salilacus]|uniref:vanadium-dependent haloperoxidase n=1 Tax=Lunatibacter salilacus TaxID=2483804 RepID=UPI001F396360|nr:vanadium-dependent haloperoxidase [Lunatibacter salilacus]
MIISSLRNISFSDIRTSSIIKLSTFFICLMFASSCQTPESDKDKVLGPELIGWVTEAMTDIMVHDITNPPLAARFYAYASLAGYEAISQENPDVLSFHGVLNDYPEMKVSGDFPNHHPHVSAVLAMIETAATMQPSGQDLHELRDSFLDSCRFWGFSDRTLEDAMGYGKEISSSILAYAQQDLYKNISNYPRYTPKQEDGYWYPTPPAYFAPVEPYFNSIRPFTLVQPDQFKPKPPVTFSTSTDSEFYKLMQEVYEVELTKEQREIAAFWDCNPFALEETGHLMVGLKQISPGGHWMGITNIACKDANLSFEQAMEITAIVAIGLTDGFLSCWDEKYRSNRIRPETAIRKYIDTSYRPLLQTPPFPEYLSGHSTISTTAATILTHYFGDNFSYTDTVEEKYQLPSRDFTSFLQASEEASISRLYGGIHFMDAIVEGQEQGKLVGNWVIQTLENSGLASPLSLSSLSITD